MTGEPEARSPEPRVRARPRAQSPEPRAPSGSVALVGAGPGDPGLWTVRAVRVLEDADLVLYDALVDVNALRRATKAQCFCVGKRARRDSVPQDTINRLMIRAAKQGKRVVRLKGGDPFVFGRGGEEALALAMAGIACEIVPGVTTAVAAPELAGIPVTHRGIASGFLVLAGHTSEAVDNTLQSVRPNSVSIVMLMSIGRARRPGVEVDGARLVGRHAIRDRVCRFHAGRLDMDRGARPARSGDAARRSRWRACRR